MLMMENAFITKKFLSTTMSGQNNEIRENLAWIAHVTFFLMSG